MDNDRLSPAQRKKIEERRAPKRHAIDRLIERHFPDSTDADAELLIDAMAGLCTLAWIKGDTKTAILVNRETDDSVIYDLDLFEDHRLIRVCFNPQTKMIRTVLPST